MDSPTFNSVIARKLSWAQEEFKTLPRIEAYVTKLVKEACQRGCSESFKLLSTNIIGRCADTEMPALWQSTHDNIGLIVHSAMSDIRFSFEQKMDLYCYLDSEYNAICDGFKGVHRGLLKVRPYIDAFEHYLLMAGWLQGPAMPSPLLHSFPSSKKELG